jgi:hypothetical protein
LEIYKTKKFEKLLRKTSLSDADLKKACIDMESGLIDADYGGHLYKKRIAIHGKGKSGGYRTIIGAKLGKSYFFLFMFAKGNKGSLDHKEEKAFKDLAKLIVSFSDEKISSMLLDGSLLKINLEVS